jgi:hypothetical protein
VEVEGRCEEVGEQGREEGRMGSKASTHLGQERSSPMQRGSCSLHPKNNNTTPIRRSVAHSLRRGHTR